MATSFTQEDVRVVSAALVGEIGTDVSINKTVGATVLTPKQRRKFAGALKRKAWRLALASDFDCVMLCLKCFVLKVRIARLRIYRRLFCTFHQIEFKRCHTDSYGPEFEKRQNVMHAEKPAGIHRRLRFNLDTEISCNWLAYWVSL
ncbi:hypothetical protein LP417_25725 [Polaromonas sp. P1-6]|nr:hypothetical protein LP417_25725 [Polaromonas sp. P1-6]